MSARDAILAAVDRWMTCLDGGDIDGLVACCDPEIVVANDGLPTTTGLDTIRERYGPRIEQFSMASKFSAEHVAVYGDVAIVVGRWEVKATDKKSGAVNTAGGRLLLNYRKQRDGAWRIVADINNQ